MKKKSHYKQPKTSWDDSYDQIPSEYKKDGSKWASAKTFEKDNPFYTKKSNSKGDFILDGVYQDS